MEVITPKLNDTERRKIIPEGNNNQKNTFAETHSETVKQELFEIPGVGRTGESLTTNTNNKRRSTKILAPKIATQQKRNSLVETIEKNGGGEEFPYRSTASTSQNFT